MSQPDRTGKAPPLDPAAVWAQRFITGRMRPEPQFVPFEGRIVTLPVPLAAPVRPALPTTLEGWVDFWDGRRDEVLRMMGVA
jgi:hypothetical protein